jgi:ferrochelatase
MSADGMTRAVAFSQYPQFSCTTTGSSLNHLWRELIARGMESKFKWSLVDRWAEHPTFIAAVQRRIELGLAEFGPQSEQDKVLIVFSAHSLPMRVVARGDAYPQEVSATVAAVMRNLRSGAPEGALNSTTLPPPRSNRYILAWQSQVGPLPWLGPQTGEVLAGLGAQGHQHVLVVPIAFTSDHVETLYEIDEEYAHLAAESGIKHFRRAPSLNDEPLLADAMAQLVAAHLKKGDEVCTEQYGLNCAGCTNPICKSVVNPVAPYQKLRDQAQPDSPLAKNNPVKQQHLQQF